MCLTITATTKQQQHGANVYSRDELLLHRDRPVVCPKGIPMTPATTTPIINTSYVRQQLTRIRTYKARGPDDISPRVLKICAEQLASP
ncbi:unnamed protein product [Boreogadus saida]